MDQAVADQGRPALAASRRRLLLAASLISTFMVAVESTIVATAMPTIIADLGGFRLFSWVFAAPVFLVSIQTSVGCEARGAATGSVMFMRCSASLWVPLYWAPSSNSPSTTGCRARATP
jgi:hypothetical protein